MTQSQREAFMTKIQEEMEAAKTFITKLQELTKPIAPDNAIGRVSRMDAINNRSVNEEGLRKAQVRLQRLERQLARCDTEDIGKCTRCGVEIRFERLMFLPDSFRCVACARRG